MEKISTTAITLLIRLLHLYRNWISPLLGNRCRFHPTCSQYTEEAIVHYGLLQGSWMAIKRLLCCHPFHPGGHNPVKISK